MIISIPCIQYYTRPDTQPKPAAFMRFPSLLRGSRLRSFRLALAGALLLAGAVPALRAQQQKPEQKPDDVPTLSIDVKIVNIFFNVKDKRGALVPGLTKDDFHVFEEG